MYKAFPESICKLQQAWFVVNSILLMHALAAVAPYIATITQFEGIILADEFLTASSDIFNSVSYMSVQLTSCVLSHGILPMK